MLNFLKHTWWVFLLITAGGVIFILGFYSNKFADDQGVVLSDMFHPQEVKTPLENTVPGTVSRQETPTSPSKMGLASVNRHGAGFVIQVYSFQDRDRAQMALQALKDRGYQAFLATNDLGSKGVWYRVRVGGIADQEAANMILQEIRKAYNSGFIINSPN